MWMLSIIDATEQMLVCLFFFSKTLWSLIGLHISIIFKYVCLNALSLGATFAWTQKGHRLFINNQESYIF